MASWHGVIYLFLLFVATKVPSVLVQCFLLQVLSFNVGLFAAYECLRETKAAIMWWTNCFPLLRKWLIKNEISHRSIQSVCVLSLWNNRLWERVLVYKTGIFPPPPFRRFGLVCPHAPLFSGRILFSPDFLNVSVSKFSFCCHRSLCVCLGRDVTVFSGRNRSSAQSAASLNKAPRCCQMMPHFSLHIWPFAA